MIGGIFTFVSVLVEIGIGLDPFQSDHSTVYWVIHIGTVAVIGEVDLWRFLKATSPDFRGKAFLD